MASGSNIRERLAAIREIKEKQGEESPRKVQPGPNKKPTLVDPSWNRIGEYTYEKTSILPDLTTNSLQSSLLLPSTKKLSDVLFFDLETTGLSTGAGNVVFLAGFGRFEEGRLVVKQYFLSDFPGEREFLRALLTILTEEAVYVSYNGRGFDSHILTSRFLINRMRIAFPMHIDLLHYTRRLWKRTLGCCTLANIEEKVLSSTP